MSDGGPDSGRPTTGTAFDALFDLLSDRRRRRALYHLAATDGCSLSDLVDAVADAEAADAAGPSTDDRSAVRVSLVHVHLPRLAEAGIVSFDRGDGRIDYHPDRRLSACLDWARFEERSDYEGSEDSRWPPGRREARLAAETGANVASTSDDDVTQGDAM